MENRECKNQASPNQSRFEVQTQVTMIKDRVRTNSTPSKDPVKRSNKVQMISLKISFY